MRRKRRHRPLGATALERKEYDGSATSAQVLWSGVANKKHVPLRLQATLEDGGALQVYWGSNVAGKRLCNVYAGAAGGVAWQYDKSAPDIPEGETLYVINSAGNVKVCLEAQEVPVIEVAAVAAAPEPDPEYDFTAQGTLEVWYAARLETGLTDLDVLASITDQSGNGRDATQASPTFRARYETGIQNGLASYNFAHSANDNYYALTASFQCGTAIAVLNSAENPFGDFNGMWTEAGAADFLLVNSGGTLMRTAGKFGSNLYINGALGTNMDPVASHQVVGGFHAGTPATIASWSFGSDNLSGARAWRGYYDELLVYAEILTGAKVIEIQEELKTLYGIS